MKNQCIHTSNSKASWNYFNMNIKTTYEGKPKSEVAHLTKQMLVKCTSSFTNGLMNLLTTTKIFNTYVIYIL